MSPYKRKRFPSPLATSGSRRREIARTNITTQDRVAPTQHQPQAVDVQHTPGEHIETGFSFGSPQANVPFTFVPPSHTLHETTPAATMALRGPDTTFITPPGDASADPPSGGSAVVATPPPNGTTLDFIDEDQMAITTPVVTRSFFVVYGEGPFGPQQVPTGSAEVFGSLLTPTGREPAPVGEVEDDTRTELSYVSYGDQDHACRAINGEPNDEDTGHAGQHDADRTPVDEVNGEGTSESGWASCEDHYTTDRSVGTPSSGHATIVGRTTPHVPISSRQHSAYQARMRGSGESRAGSAAMVESCRGQSTSNSGERISDVLAYPNPQATDQPAVVKTENSPPANADDLPGGLGRDPTPARAISDGRPSGRFANRSPANVEGRHVFEIPHGVGAGIANNPTVDPNRNRLAPVDDPMDGDIALPHAPRRRVRTRGVFIIGGGAYIRIDEGIEVHLKEGVDGQVDFVI